jgi:DNA adenine methylase
MNADVLHARHASFGKARESECDGTLSPRFGGRYFTAPNVNSVKLRTPFRYAGGKTWFVPFFKLYAQRRGQLEHLVEPFAGGAIVGLTAAIEGWAKRVTLAELDPDVSAVWATILRGHGRWLADRVRNFRFSARSVESVLTADSRSARNVAFATILRNRIHRGGILAPRAGVLKRGERNNGLGSRWYPETLANRILEIVKHKKHISFVQGDGLQLLRTMRRRKSVTFFIDPPYPNAGKRLYFCSDVEPRRIFEAASELNGEVILTYEDTSEIRGLCTEFGFRYRIVLMQNTHHARRRELVIGRELEWLS